MKKKAKVGTFVTLALLVPALFVVMEYLRNWRHSINVLFDSSKRGW